MGFNSGFKGLMSTRRDVTSQ